MILYKVFITPEYRIAVVSSLISSCRQLVLIFHGNRVHIWYDTSMYLPFARALLRLLNNYACSTILGNSPRGDVTLKISIG